MLRRREATRNDRYEAMSWTAAQDADVRTRSFAMVDERALTSILDC